MERNITLLNNIITEKEIILGGKIVTMNKLLKIGFELVSKKLRTEKGLTLSEVLVVTALILILTTIVMFNYREGQRGVLLERAANSLAQEIRVVQEAALSGKECPPSECGGAQPYGYGVYFSINPPPRVSYIYYADILPTGGGNERYTSAEKLGDIDFGEGVYLKEIKIDGSSVNNVCINFKPPDPKINISSWPAANKGKAELIIALSTDPGETKTILINKFGLIEIR